jgi:predicted site-specific integrase-resolvase
MKMSEEITPRESAVRLGIRLDALYPLLWAGKIEARKIDGRWFVSAADVTRLLGARRKSKLARESGSNSSDDRS